MGLVSGTRNNMLASAGERNDTVRETGHVAQVLL
jgi:hypothetical protein